MEYGLLPEELLACIFNNINEISFNNVKFQKCIHSLRSNPEFYQLLKPFRFSGSPVAPFSEVLDNALFNLQLGEKLKRLNPDLTKYSVSDKFKTYFEQNVEPKLGGGGFSKDLLKRLSVEVGNYLNE